MMSKFFGKKWNFLRTGPQFNAARGQPPIYSRLNPLCNAGLIDITNKLTAILYSRKYDIKEIKGKTSPNINIQNKSTNP
jgi:hypothetical protein